MRCDDAYSRMAGLGTILETASRVMVIENRSPPYASAEMAGRLAVRTAGRDNEGHAGVK
jgi:hypothetical protein